MDTLRVGPSKHIDGELEAIASNNLRKSRVSKINTLPTELLHLIICHLSLQSLKCLRLTSRTWSLLTSHHLIAPIFTTLPHRPDLQRLSSISQHPLFSRQIRALSFNHAELHEYSARHNSYFLQYMLDPEERIIQQTETWEAYAAFKEAKERELPGACDEDVLTQVLGRLGSLRRVSVSLMECPFPEDVPELLRRIWVFPSTRLLPRVATTERFSAILNAMSRNNETLRIEELKHDRLPFEFFAQSAPKMELLETAFGNLTSLNLAMDYSDMPNNLHACQAFANLGECLRKARGLRTLELAWLGRRKVEVQPLLVSFKDDGFVFEKLESLKLQGIISTEIELGDFIISQKGALKTVQLGGVGVRSARQPSNGGIFLSEGRFKDLFERLGYEIPGVKVLVQGDLKGLESGEYWLLDGPEEVGSLSYEQVEIETSDVGILIPMHDLQV